MRGKKQKTRLDKENNFGRKVTLFKYFLMKESLEEKIYRKKISL
jgi:hypothetical protein